MCLVAAKAAASTMQCRLQDIRRNLEMSLNFAEVEGERQKLVMTVRNLQKG